MKVLITGGAGFIGSHLAEKLLKLGYEVRVLDNLSSGSLENLSQIMDEIEFVKGDCKNRRDVLDSIKDVEVIFHLAANPEVRLELSAKLLLEASAKEVYHTLLATPRSLSIRQVPTEGLRKAKSRRWTSSVRHRRLWKS